MKPFMLFAAGIVSAALALAGCSKAESNNELVPKGQISIPVMPGLTPDALVFDNRGIVVVKGVYFQDGGNPDTRPAYPQNLVDIICVSNECDESSATIDGYGAMGTLDINQTVYDVKYRDAHSLMAVLPLADGNSQALYVNLDSKQARIEIHMGTSTFEWKIVGGRYAMTHEPRLSYVCRKFYSYLKCTQK